MPDVVMKYSRYKSFAGWTARTNLHPVICQGTDAMARTIELTAKLEAPYFGTVQSYDGCGVSAGILHHTATFPGKLTLGGYWALLADIEHDTGLDLDIDLNPSSPVQYRGRALDGDGARAYFTGSTAGVTAQGNAKIRERIRAICELFSNPETFAAQIRAAEKFLATTAVRRLMHGEAAPLYFKPGRVVPSIKPETSDFLSYEHCFAYCVAQSFAVNNPKAAKDTVAHYVKTGLDPTSTAGYTAMIRARPNWSSRGLHLVNAAETSGRWSHDEVESLRKAVLG